MPAIRYKINGRTVTEEEYAAYQQRRQQKLRAAGMAFFDGQPASFYVVGEDGVGGYMTGFKNGQQLGSLHPWIRRIVLAAAKKAGVSLEGKRHISQLGKIEDPSSWVDGWGDLVRKAAAQNKNVQPSNSLQKTHKAIPVPPPKKCRLAPKLVNRMIERETARDPGLTQRMSRNELEEMVTEKYGS